MTRRTERAMARGAALAMTALLVAACGGAGLPPAQGTAPSGAAGPSALPAGTYTSQVFTPPATFTLPDGWRLTSDTASYLALYPVTTDYAGIHLFRDPQAASQAETCPASPEPGIGTLWSEMSTWIRGLPGLDVSTPRMVSIGGLRGVEMDVRIADTWRLSCPFANGLPAVPLFVADGGNLRWVVAGSEKLRIALLDVPGGGTVVVDIDAFDGAEWDTLLPAAKAIVAGLEFQAD